MMRGMLGIDWKVASECRCPYQPWLTLTKTLPTYERLQPLRVEANTNQTPRDPRAIACLGTPSSIRQALHDDP